jgi:glycosyltransferase involved in cell wall biosynthesis
MSFPRARVALFNSADPRGLKVGGIETYIRDYIAYHPEDMELLFVGPDEIGDLETNVITRTRFRGRSFSYLSLGKREDSTNAYPEKIAQSETLAFLRLMMGQWRMLRTTLQTGRYSAEIRRVEYAPFMASLGVPFIQMLHLRGSRKLPMSGLQNRLWPVTRTAEYLAAGLCQRFYTVNADITRQLRRRSWPFGHKFETLTTWVDPRQFKPMPFSNDDTLHLVFAGRTDDFKQLGLMMQVVARVRASLPRRVAFHYIGDGDLTTYPEYAAIADISTNHGRRPSAQVAQLIARCSIGLLTSAFEGMPRFVLETLACGRPVVALALPQLRAIVKPGVSGMLVPPGKDAIERLALAVIETWDACRSGQMTPDAIAACVAPFRPERILVPIWDDHRQLASRGTLSYPTPADQRAS